MRVGPAEAGPALETVIDVDGQRRPGDDFDAPQLVSRPETQSRAQQLVEVRAADFCSYSALPTLYPASTRPGRLMPLHVTSDADHPQHNLEKSGTSGTPFRENRSRMSSTSRPAEATDVAKIDENTFFRRSHGSSREPMMPSWAMSLRPRIVRLCPAGPATISSKGISLSFSIVIIFTQRGYLLPVSRRPWRRARLACVPLFFSSSAHHLSRSCWQVE